MKKNLIQWSAQCQMGRNFFSLSPAAAEVVGSGFVQMLGIGTASVAIVPDSQAQQLSNDWIRKRKISAGDGKALVVKKIPGAISLTFLRSLYGVEAQPSRWDWQHDLDVPKGLLFLGIVPHHPDSIADNMRLVLHYGKESGIVNPLEFYRDFVLPQDTSAIQQAIRWNSDAMLEIHAARLLLGTSAAHAGNILVDGQGKLFSIDHEKMYWSNGSDVEMLAEHIRRPSRARAAICRIVNRLKAEDIDQLLENLPDYPWPLGSEAGTARYLLGNRASTSAYFKQRLKAFREKFPAS